MKKTLILLPSLLLTLTMFTACTALHGTRKVEKDGTTYEIDRQKGIISDGNYTYKYSYSTYDGKYTIAITYPNQSQYMRSSDGKVTWIGSGTTIIYTEPEILSEVIIENTPKQADPENIIWWILGIGAIGVGIFLMRAPRAAWEMSYGWRFKNAEPSDEALDVNRGVGMLALIAGGFMIIVAIF